MSVVRNSVRRRFLQRCESMPFGRLDLTTPEGERHRFGRNGPEAELAIRDWAVIPALAARGDIGFGEAYVAGLWESPSIEAVLRLAIRNLEHFRQYAEPRRLESALYWLADRHLRANTPRGAARNIRSHYDVGNEFYLLWLDRGMNYSSALFDGAGGTLEEGQARKHDRILDRLDDCERLLEIGCGWGGFLERAATRGHDSTGITISPSQKGYADARLDGRARVDLLDYRQQTGSYDGIVSIEMIEAVGERYWPTYFSRLKARLSADGRALIQAITVRDDRFAAYRRRSDFMRRYVFPGGMLLSEAAIRHHAGNASLRVTDRFSFGPDYARTCRSWADRLRAAGRQVRNFGHSERFLRSWLYYLESCASVFAEGHTDVMQVELAHA